MVLKPLNNISAQAVVRWMSAVGKSDLKVKHSDKKIQPYLFLDKKKGQREEFLCSTKELSHLKSKISNVVQRFLFPEHILSQLPREIQREVNESYALYKRCDPPTLREPYRPHHNMEGYNEHFHIFSLEGEQFLFFKYFDRKYSSLSEYMHNIIYTRKKNISRLPYFTFVGEDIYPFDDCPNIVHHPKLFSWHKALQHCEKENAQLPQLLSREDEENFISVLHSADGLFPIDAVFTGLRQQHKVCFCEASFLWFVQKVQTTCFLSERNVCEALTCRLFAQGNSPPPLLWTRRGIWFYRIPFNCKSQRHIFESAREEGSMRERNLKVKGFFCVCVRKDALFSQRWTVFVWSGAIASYQGWKNVYHITSHNKVNYTKRHARFRLDCVLYDSSTWITNCSISRTQVCYSMETAEQFSKVKENFTKHLQPTFTEKCTLLLAFNLAQTDWVSVDCDQPVLSHVVCHKRLMSAKARRKSQNVGNDASVKCSNAEIFRENFCFKFFWFVFEKRKQQNVKAACQKSDVLRFLDSETDSVYHMILRSTGLWKLNVVAPTQNPWSLMYFTIRKYHMRTSVEKQDSEKGFFACFKESNHYSLQSDSLFQCKDKGFVSTVFVCDKAYDCTLVNLSDVINKTVQACHVNISTRRNKHRCPHLLFLNRVGHCESFLQSDKQRRVTSGHFYQRFLLPDKMSSSGRLLPGDFVHNQSLNQESCTNPSQIPCLLGQAQCYDITDICIYRLNSVGLIYPCRTGSHIQDCKIFQCHSHFKCVGYYCVPWQYVCDAKWDCPFGAEEQVNCTNPGGCAQRFKCHKSNICLSIANICDSHIDCPFHDDEMLCALHNSVCPKHCFCLNFALLCEGVSIDFSGLGDIPYVSFNIINCSGTTFLGYFPANVLTVNITSSSVSSVSNFQALWNLAIIDLSHNNISCIQTESFTHLPKLFYIKLSFNNISHIADKSFVNLSVLYLLSLKGNCLDHFSPLLFDQVKNIIVLNLQNNHLVTIEHNANDFVSVIVVLFDKFKYCCSNVAVVCATAKLWFSTCSNLLPSKTLQTLFPIAFVIVAVPNVFALGLEARKKMLTDTHKTNPFSRISQQIYISHVFFASYLLIITATSKHFGSTFPMHDNTWKGSALCVTAFFLVLFSCFLMPVILSFLSLARYQVTLHPLDSCFKSTKFVAKCLLLINVGMCCLSTLLTCLFFVFKRNSSSLCLPHADQTQQRPEIFVFLILNIFEQIVAIIFIILNSILMVNEMLESRERSQNPRPVSKSVYVQLTALTLSHISSWIFPNIAFVTLYLTVPHPVHVHHYTIVSFMYIDPVAIPLVFLFIHQMKSK